MGYDLNRFVRGMDEEFLCPICTMVLENGVQSQHCEHTYCDACIKEWLSVIKICPECRLELKLDDIKPVPRKLKNLINKLEVKCDFESYGCQDVLKLENIKTHAKDCSFNPNAKIMCDRVCRLEMTKTEYELHNCVTKLSDLVLTQQKQINKLENELRELRANTNYWISPNGLIVYCNVIECLKDKASKNELKSILYGLQFAQNKYPLTKSNSIVDIEIIDTGKDFSAIGLTNSYKDGNNGLESNKIEFYRFICHGEILKKLRNANQTRLIRSTKWEKGDIITVGIIFIDQLDCKLINAISIYFKRNNELIYEKKLNINDIGLYPTFFTNSIGAKIIVNTTD